MIARRQRRGACAPEYGRWTTLRRRLRPGDGFRDGGVVRCSPLRRWPPAQPVALIVLPRARGASGPARSRHLDELALVRTVARPRSGCSSTRRPATSSNTAPRRYPVVILLHGVPGRPGGVRRPTVLVARLRPADRGPGVVPALCSLSSPPALDQGRGLTTSWADSEVRPGERWGDVPSRRISCGGSTGQLPYRRTPLRAGPSAGGLDGAGFGRDETWRSTNRGRGSPP